ncbi:cytidine deaminase [Acanthopleuribacter pedis]|uniref:Cytidine deaminase n=1 Tax=Acanthopleuribacter pedis TaxID=442870 RepID=A0A8J7QFK6_9BACT|nr:cytidine deaminase [Acanthopleuribacter pedis]MBO1319646.1 cytidine deaminase [Acanthopleuribacter pedis]
MRKQAKEVNLRTLIKAAWLARDRAHAPYSGFKVGAVLENDKGQLFSGCNVENANYTTGLCAERTAIVKAVSEGALKPGGIRRMVIAAKADRPAGPCGSCRQVIEEFAGEDTRVVLTNEPGKVALEFTHRELLPHAFNARDLDKE